MPYTLIDHTADMGVRVWAADLPSLFSEAARAMFEQISDIQSVTGSHTRTLSVFGFDRSDLLVNWLKELLYLFDTDGCLVKSTTLRAITDTSLSADIRYDVFDPQNHEIQAEIKAVTYHGLRIENGPGGLFATIVFDV